MDSFVCAMSVMTPSEMMSRMKYCEPSVTADAYLAPRERRVRGQLGGEGCGESDIVIYFAAALQPSTFIQEKGHFSSEKKEGTV